MHNLGHSCSKRWTVGIRMLWSLDVEAPWPAMVTGAMVGMQWESALMSRYTRTCKPWTPVEGSRDTETACGSGTCMHCKLMRLGLLPGHNAAPIFETSGKGVLCSWPSKSSNLEGRPAISHRHSATRGSLPCAAAPGAEGHHHPMPWLATWLM